MTLKIISVLKQDLTVFTILILRGSTKTLLIYNKRKFTSLYSFMKNFISLSDLKNLHSSKVKIKNKSYFCLYFKFLL